MKTHAFLLLFALPFIAPAASAIRNSFPCTDTENSPHQWDPGRAPAGSGLYVLLPAPLKKTVRFLKPALGKLEKIALTVLVSLLALFLLFFCIGFALVGSIFGPTSWIFLFSVLGAGVLVATFFSIRAIWKKRPDEPSRLDKRHQKKNR